MQALISHYLQSVQAALGRVDPADLEAVVDALYQAYNEGRRVFTLGNGASAALASHMACDLGKTTAPDLGLGPVLSGGRRLKITSLCDNAAVLTALGNDVAFEDVFVEQLKNLLEPGDLVLGISGSGGSPNVLRALEYARARGATTVGFTGGQAKAELMRERCDLCVVAPLEMIEQIEDLHVAFHHAVVVGLVRRIEGGGEGGEAR